MYMTTGLRGAVLLLGLAAGMAAGATTCETLRADIEARIAAAGVTRFVVTIVEADASAPDRVVGSCDMGRRKIVYQVDAGAEAPRPEAPMLTECRDGSVNMGGSCRK